MSPQKWIKAINAIGIVSKAGRYNGGTFAHSDLLNLALFGQTAKEWRKDNPGKKGNIRDYTDLHHLLVLANLESYNAILIGRSPVSHCVSAGVGCSAIPWRSVASLAPYSRSVQWPACAVAP